MQLFGQPQVEIGVVDQKRGVRWPSVDVGQQAAEDPPQMLKMGDDLHETDHGQVPDVGDEAGLLRLQQVASQPDDVKVLHPWAQVAHELGAVEIAGRFPARDEQTHVGNGV